MTSACVANPFKHLREVTIHPLLSCNLGCNYCYQDAARTYQSVVAARPGREWSNNLVKMLCRSERNDLDIVVTGGEPLLLGFQWFKEFFDETRATLELKGKQVTYIIQTNASLPVENDMLVLFKKHAVRFSVHYDGLVEGEELQSQRRHNVIQRLGEEGFPLSAIVVGTQQALDVLPQTLDFFHRCGVAHYHLNPVAGEGRGGRTDLNPLPRNRAEAEFQTGYHAWQNQFQPHDSSILWKFVHFCRAELNHKPRRTRVLPLKCGGGKSSITVYPDGAIYPCGLYCDLTRPSFYVSDLDALDNSMTSKLVTTCQQRSEALEKRCLSCEAVIFCKAYCAMAAIRDNHERLCLSQGELVKIMRENIPITLAIANSFLEYLRKKRGGGLEPFSAKKAM